FGGVGPAGMNDSRGVSSACVTLAMSAWPARKLESPRRFSTPSTWWHPGLRRSQSMRRTRDPDSASVVARFTLLTVFPSAGRALVTRTTRGGAPGAEKRTAVRIVRYASAEVDH